MKHFMSILFLAAALVQAADARAQVCEGQGNAAMIVKGRCTAGYPLKFKLAGAPFAKYKVYMDIGPGPVEWEGVGEFCLDFGSEWSMIRGGRLNNRGLRTFQWKLPATPDDIGRSICLQMAVEDESAPNGVAISNGVCFKVCSECPGVDPCEGFVRKLGFIIPIDYEGDFPAVVQSLAFRKNDENDVVGMYDLLFDPLNPPLPASSKDGAMTVMSVKRIGEKVIVHAMVDGSKYTNSRLPRETTLRVRVGDVVIERRIHSSCSMPIGVGSYFPPFAITYLEDTGS